MRRSILFALFVAVSVYAQTTLREGLITAGHTDDRWTSRIAIENPGDVTAFVTISGASLEVAPHETEYSSLAGPFVSSQPVLVYRLDENFASGARVITEATVIPKRRRSVQFFPGQSNPTPHTATLTPSKDNTLYETVDGGTSNGAGVHVVVGRTAAISRRRALLAFDLGSQIPPGSQITKVSLQMVVTRTIAFEFPVGLHAVTKDWGEGTSNAGDSRDGGGTSAQPGDATWLHTFRPNQLWTSRGGDFDATADATAPAGNPGPVTWDSTAALVARVQGWVDQPATNFGWLLEGDEVRATTTKEFASREAVAPADRPRLTVEYTTR